MLSTLMISTLLRDAQELQPDVVRLRRALHRHPELGLQLPSTQAAVIQALDGLGLSIRKGGQLTSVVATLEGARPGPSDRKSTRLNSSHGYISYAVFCLKKKESNKVFHNSNVTIYTLSHEF